MKVFWRRLHGLFSGRWLTQPQAQAVAPKALWAALAAGLFVCAALSTVRGQPAAKLEPLGEAPSVLMARLVSMEEPVAFAKMANLVVQAHDIQPGASLPWGQIDYKQLISWLDLSLQLDPRAQYPLMAGARLYTQVVNDTQRQRQMMDWVARRFLEDPAKRWPWMAHVVYVAKTQVKDAALAMQYAELLRIKTEQLREVPAWARQLAIFLRIQMNQLQAARFLIANLIDSGQVSDPNELRFLMHTLGQLEEAH